MKIIVFLPCRAGSQRVPNKNTRPFAGEPGGLLGVKLRQVLATPGIDEIVLSTNDPVVIEIGRRYLEQADGRMRIDLRPDELCSATTSTDALIAHVPRIIPEGHILWTHVTSPFYDTAEYVAAIAAYRQALAAGTHDSLMGVLELRTFLWNATGPINYDRALEKWPRTQTLPPLYEINSAIFLADVAIYREHRDRIGARPLLHPVPKAKNLDVDWEDDFHLAAEIWKLRHAS